MIALIGRREGVGRWQSGQRISAREFNCPSVGRVCSSGCINGTDQERNNLPAQKRKGSRARWADTDAWIYHNDEPHGRRFGGGRRGGARTPQPTRQRGGSILAT